GICLMAKKETARRNADIRANNERILNNVRGIPKRQGGKVDFWLLAVIIALALFGLYMVLSTTYYNCLIENISPFYSFRKQTIILALGIGCMLVFALIDDYTWIKSWALLLWGLGIASLILVYIVGSDANGAGRWIALGPVTIQPSEFVKYFTVIALAAWIHTCPFPVRTENKKRQFWLELARYAVQLLCFGIPLLLVFFQPAMSMSIVIAVASLGIIFAAGMEWVKFGSTVLAGMVAAAVGIFSEPFRRERILSYFSGNIDALGTGMQAVQSKYAFASGNLFGKGMNYSRQKYNFLPESETDFIFPIIGEEFGFIGVILVVAAYAFVFWRGIQIASHARCRFGAYTALGITLIITLQALMNMMVATGIMPVTGQALPLISQGGSSLISHMCAFGILLNISKDRYE
ncbi:MAG: cell division protein FtsW, partial [Clostridia bacterium]|nr:cell division protein FtsW [Clostridia bacterium]